MKKGLIMAASIVGAALIAIEAMKKMNIKNAIDEKLMDENSADECQAINDESEVKKTNNHNENMVRVNNSLISIKIKAFSK
ncbi:hypothetical protein NBE98_08175 [Clostridium swellfunianum]|uniref:hypothetical protein n=1 Tax=Clostridium swellfunianum TaxID=1367462 RepID=UPI00202E1BCA|nr:hypothetical protein [Clostridium swellfunianum]MCM0648350.1 hypothetical protein [Clostridium swellfunianum]